MASAGFNRYHKRLMNRLTFGLRLLVCFLVFDGVEKLAQAAALWAAGYPLRSGPVFVEYYFPLFLAASFDALLAPLILLRTRAGRFWGIIYFGAVTALGLFLLVVEPRRWLEMGEVARVKELATYALNLAFVFVLAGRRASRVLTR